MSEERRQRERAMYANDPAYREKKKAAAAARYAAKRDEILPKVRAYGQLPYVKERERERGLRRYREWRERWIAELGGACVVCGTTADLEFDHVDWREKSFNVAIRWRYTEVEQEMLKCQLLCVTHHREKTTGDLRSMQKLGRGSYGTFSG